MYSRVLFYNTRDKSSELIRIYLMFILTKQGQTPLDVSVQSMGDGSIKTQDLEDARREIIALSGIPAPLNYNGFIQ